MHLVCICPPAGAAEKNKDGAFWGKKPDIHHPITLVLRIVLLVLLVTLVITLVLDCDPQGREMQKHYAVNMGVFAISILVFAKMEAVELRPLPRDSMTLHEDLHYVFPSCP